MKRSQHQTTYATRPGFKQKFRPSVATTIINNVLEQKLKGQKYQLENLQTWVKQLTEEIKTRLKSQNFPRYKFLINIVMGEMRGQGVRMGSRAIWDADTDNMASGYFMNQHMYCVVTCFAIYFY